MTYVVLFWVMFALNMLVMVRYFQILRFQRKQNALFHDMAEINEALMIFGSAMSNRGIGIPCDDCGNIMTAHDEINVMKRGDQIYVGHRTHQRHVDWSPPA